MAGRRPNGRSSVYYSEADGRWHGWVTMGRLDRRHRTGRTEADLTSSPA